jgi:hypothetical protein
MENDVEVHYRKFAVNQTVTHQPKQLDLFEPAPAKRARRNITGRVKFFSPQNKPTTTSNEAVPFDDPIGF